MLATADEDIAPNLEADFLDRPFSDMDFDSLSVLEIATRIQQEFHLELPDEAIADMTTPRDVVDYVSGRLRETV
jgi:act minimal PKS acyl carrier protein